MPDTTPTAPSTILSAFLDAYTSEARKLDSGCARPEAKALAGNPAATLSTWERALGASLPGDAQALHRVLVGIVLDRHLESFFDTWRRLVSDTHLARAILTTSLLLVGEELGPVTVLGSDSQIVWGTGDEDERFEVSIVLAMTLGKTFVDLAVSVLEPGLPPKVSFVDVLFFRAGDGVEVRAATEKRARVLRGHHHHSVEIFDETQVLHDPFGCARRVLRIPPPPLRFKGADGSSARSERARSRTRTARTPAGGAQ